MDSKRKPWLAGLLGLALPGLGHLYAGQAPLAAAALLLNVVAAILVVGAPLVSLRPANVSLAFVALLVGLIGIPLHAAKTAQAAPQDYKLKPYNRWYLYLGLYCISAFLLRPWVYNYTKANLVEAFRVPAASMEPTIKVGDYLYVAKWAGARTALHRGTVVVFESPEEPGLKVIKRILGLPGDTLAMDAGMLYRNGHTLAEPYAVRLEPGRSEDPIQRAKMQAWQSRYLVSASADLYRPDLEYWGPVVVPADSLFVLGDNRDAS